MRDGLRMILGTNPGIIVVGEAEDGLSAFRQVQEKDPDVVVMDISMPRMTGIEAAGEISRHCPRTQVIFLSMHGAPEQVVQALRAGALGYLVKESAGAEVVAAVIAVAQGRRYLSATITEALVERYLQGDDAKESPELTALSSREREVLKLVAEGNSSARIAELLCLSPKTVDTYRSRLMRKLGVSDLAGLVRVAIRHGLVPLE
jgi:DNA-binding NarL/FixJ family response regulator